MPSRRKSFFKFSDFNNGYKSKDFNGYSAYRILISKYLPETGTVGKPHIHDNKVATGLLVHYLYNK